MQRLAEVVSTMLGRPAAVAEWAAADVPYESGSPATGALQRLHGRTVDGQEWSVFCKVVQHVRHWPKLHVVPPEFRERFASEFPWRTELAMWEPDFASRLPDGMRVPHLYLLEDLGDDRVRIWMEDIHESGHAWDRETFRRAARALGGLAALRSDPELLAGGGDSADLGLRRYVDTRVRLTAPLVLGSDELWQHPLLRGNGGDRLRADLIDLMAHLDLMLDRLDALPQAMPHGDASPQNLLVPRDEPGTFVSIDISFQCPHPVGFDLGQLLIGLVHAGLMPASALPETYDAILRSFWNGYRHHGGTASLDETAQGCILSLILRAGFTSLPVELLGTPDPGRATVFRERTALTRFLIDLVRGSGAWPSGALALRG
jgi:hypothetical protein